ncbi:MAG: hypothetical protein ABSG62_08020 [Terracidiphilus sp.]
MIDLNETLRLCLALYGAGGLAAALAAAAPVYPSQKASRYFPDAGRERTPISAPKVSWHFVSETYAFTDVWVRDTALDLALEEQIRR